MTEPIRWTTPLGVSVLLFMAIGALWIVIGLLAVPLHKRANPDYLFVSTPTDTAYFGGTPSELAPPGSALAKLRTLLLTVISGLLVVAGALVVSVAWLALREGHPWALATLAVGIALAVGFWALALLPYFQAQIPVTLGDLPPFMWVPAALLIPATVLGWIGLQ